MRLLVIGRTALVGRHLVDAPLAAGHDVTLFHRGRTGRDLFPRVQAAGLNDGNDGGPGASRSSAAPGPLPVLSDQRLRPP